jgi:hypothetical protein
MAFQIKINCNQFPDSELYIFNILIFLSVTLQYFQFRTIVPPANQHSYICESRSGPQKSVEGNG